MTTDEARAASAQEVAALRRAAANVSDRRTLMDDGFWVSQKEMRALDAALAAIPAEELDDVDRANIEVERMERAATPAERPYPDPRPVVERGGIAATTADDERTAAERFNDAVT